MESAQFNENYSPNVKSVLRFTGRVNYKAVDEIKEEMREYIKLHGAQETGRFCTFVYKALVAMGTLNIEIFVPIDKKIPSSRRFKFMEELQIQGCIMSKYQGFFMPPDSEYTKLKFEALDMLWQMHLSEFEAARNKN
ncbi:MAG: hypothetical protein LBE35_00135 [Clostridiales bacterium]|jgi:effector-binding domain-containing protein|nr:hypothetical protein [Clostridiales bacterium]